MNNDLSDKIKQADKDKSEQLLSKVGWYKYNGKPLKSKSQPGVLLFLQNDLTYVQIIGDETFGLTLTVESPRTGYRYPIDLNTLVKAFEPVEKKESYYKPVIVNL